MNTVRNWIENGMPYKQPKKGKRQYDLLEIRKWKESRAKDNAAKADNSAAVEHRRLRNDMEMRKLQAETERAERQNRLLEGEFIEKWKLEEFVSRYNQFSRDRLLRLPVEIQAAFPVEVRQILVEELTGKIETFLESLHSWQRRVMDLPPAENVQGRGRPRGT